MRRVRNASAHISVSLHAKRRVNGLRRRRRRRRRRALAGAGRVAAVERRQIGVGEDGLGKRRVEAASDARALALLVSKRHFDATQTQRRRQIGRIRRSANVGGGGHSPIQLQIVHVIQRLEGHLEQLVAAPLHFHGQFACGYVAEAFHFAPEFGLLELEAAELTDDGGGLEAHVVAEYAAEQVHGETPPVHQAIRLEHHRLRSKNEMIERRNLMKIRVIAFRISSSNLEYV